MERATFAYGDFNSTMIRYLCGLKRSGLGVNGMRGKYEKGMRGE